MGGGTLGRGVPLNVNSGKSFFFEPLVEGLLEAIHLLGKVLQACLEGCDVASEEESRAKMCSSL